MPARGGLRLLPAQPRPRQAGVSRRLPVHLPADSSPRLGRIRRTGRAAIRRAAFGQGQGLVVPDRLRQGHRGSRGGLRRPGLLRLRGRLPVRPGAGWEGLPAVEGPGAVGDPQPAGGRARRSAVRLVHELRRLREHERNRPGGRGAAAAPVDPPLRGHVQAPARLRGRADVHPHRRRPDLRRRAGDGAPALAAVLARRARLVHLAALPQGASAGPAGRAEAVAPPLPRRGHGQAALGSALHGLSQLEPGAAAGRAREAGRLHVRHGPLCPQRDRHLRHAPRGGQGQAGHHRGLRQLALQPRQPVLPGQPQGHRAGMGPRHGQRGVAEGLLPVRLRRG